VHVRHQARVVPVPPENVLMRIDEHACLLSAEKATKRGVATEASSHQATKPARPERKRDHRRPPRPAPSVARWLDASVPSLHFRYAASTLHSAATTSSASVSVQPSWMPMRQ